MCERSGSLRLIFSSLTSILFYLFRNRILEIEDFWNRNIGFVVYFNSIFFAIGHIYNIKFEGNDWFFMPLILAPFFVYGLSFAYIRIRLGIIYSITLHFIILLISYGLPEIVNSLKAIGRS